MVTLWLASMTIAVLVVFFPIKSYYYKMGRRDGRLEDLSKSAVDAKDLRRVARAWLYDITDIRVGSLFLISDYVPLLGDFLKAFEEEVEDMIKRDPKRAVQCLAQWTPLLAALKRDCESISPAQLGTQAKHMAQALAIGAQTVPKLIQGAAVMAQAMKPEGEEPGDEQQPTEVPAQK